MKKIAFSVLVFGLALGAASPDMAFAKHDKGSHGKSHDHAKAKKNSPEAFLIGASNREAIKGYLKEHYGRTCPPGLAKKNNGCLPPGIAKKYTLGQPLPEGVLATSLPDDLLKLLYLPRYGQKYVQVDKDILLIDQASRKVIDAITLLSAIGN